MAKDTVDSQGIAVETKKSAPKGDTAEVERVAVTREMRPLYSEVARLSATLGLARKACYTGDPTRAHKALTLLGKQLPLAIDVAELMLPAGE